MLSYLSAVSAFSPAGYRNESRALLDEAHEENKRAARIVKVIVFRIIVSIMDKLAR
jgi:hypothetical protein